MNKFELGEKAYDRITGFNGVITARAVYNTGYISYLIENVDSTGRPIESWYDERRLESKED